MQPVALPTSALRMHVVNFLTNTLYLDLCFDLSDGGVQWVGAEPQNVFQKPSSTPPTVVVPCDPRCHLGSLRVVGEPGQKPGPGPAPKTKEFDI